MESTLNEIETQEEGTNLEIYGASQSHTVTGTVSENRNLIRNRGKHDNVKTMSWTSKTMVLPTMKLPTEMRETLFVLLMLIIVPSMVKMGMENASHWQRVRMTPMMEEIQSQNGSQGPFAICDVHCNQGR